jgi:serine/threonine protein kinase
MVSNFVDPTAGLQSEVKEVLHRSKNCKVERVCGVQNGQRKHSIIKTYYKDYIDREARKLKTDNHTVMSNKEHIMDILEHPHIVEIEKVKQMGNGEWCMVMEDEGEALNIEQYPVDDVRNWLVQLSEAVLYLHRDVQMCHCDIKPDNIVLKDNVVKLCDFDSILRFNNGPDVKRSWNITPAFAPPELCHSSMMTKSVITVVHGKPLDMWCLGVTFYCLLFGKTPFEARLNLAKLYESVIDQKIAYYTVISKDKKQILLPSDLEFVLKALLNKDPSKRFTAQQLYDYVHQTG